MRPDRAGSRCASIRRIDLRLEHFVLADHVVGVLDMEDVNRRTGIRIDGILGEDILGRGLAVRIKFKDQRLELEQ